MDRWFVIHSKPRKEEFLCEQLSIRNIESYYPCIKVRRVNPRARKYAPFFPGYLFIHTDIEKTGQATLQWLPGAIGLVRLGGDLAVIPDNVLLEIRQRVETISKVDFNQTGNIKAGDPVLICDGPFMGYEAIFDTRIDGTKRVRVFLKLVQDRSWRLELFANQIQRCPDV